MEPLIDEDSGRGLGVLSCMGCQIGTREDLCGAEGRMCCVNCNVGGRGQKAHWVNPDCVYRAFAMCGLNHSYDNHGGY